MKTRGEIEVGVLSQARLNDCSALHAIFGQVFDELEKRAKDGKADIVKLIVDYVQEPPVTGLERGLQAFPVGASASEGTEHQGVVSTGGESAPTPASNPSCARLKRQCTPDTTTALQDEEW